MNNRAAILILLSGIALSTLCANVASAANCQLRKVAELAVKFAEGFPLIQVTVNGKTGWMGFSNRSNTTAFYDYSLPETGLKSYPTNFFTNNDGHEAPVSGVHIDKFGIGGVSPQPIDLLVVTPLNHGTKLWGVISTSLFPGDALDLDYNNRRVRLYSEVGCGGKSLAYWNSEALPIQVQRRDPANFFGTVDGVKVLFEINSSSSETLINRSAVEAAHLTLVDSLRPSNWGGDSSSKQKSTSYVLDKVALTHKLVIGSEILDDVKIRTYADQNISSIPGYILGNSREYDYTSPRITLGIDFLLAHHVLISPTQFVAYITREKPEGFEPTVTGVSPSDAPSPWPPTTSPE